VRKSRVYRIDDRIASNFIAVFVEWARRGSSAFWVGREYLRECGQTGCPASSDGIRRRPASFAFWWRGSHGVVENDEPRGWKIASAAVRQDLDLDLDSYSRLFLDPRRFLWHFFLTSYEKLKDELTRRLVRDSVSMYMGIMARDKPWTLGMMRRMN